MQTGALWAKSVGAPVALRTLPPPVPANPVIVTDRNGDAAAIVLGERLPARRTAVVVRVTLKGQCRSRRTMWALAMPWSTAAVAGSKLPLFPHRLPGGLVQCRTTRIASISWRDVVFPGVSEALLRAVMASPCAAERWWFCGHYVPGIAQDVGRPLAVAPGATAAETHRWALSVPTPIALPDCTVALAPISPGGSTSPRSGQTYCGRCGAVFSSQAEYAAACAPDAALPLTPRSQETAVL